MSSIRQVHRPLQILRTGSVYLLLVLASLLLLFPLFFALSIALQGQTITPQFLPDFGNLDWGVFRDVLAQQPDLMRWMLNSFVVSSLVTLGVLASSMPHSIAMLCRMWLRFTISAHSV